MNDSNQSTQRRLSRWHIQLSTLLMLVAIFAVLAAWFADHRMLRAQIKPPESKTVVVYRLTNASPNRVIDELTRLYPEQIFISGATGKSTGMTKIQLDKSVAVASDVSLQEQIALIIQHFDRYDTDLVDAEYAVGEIKEVTR